MEEKPSKIISTLYIPLYIQANSAFHPSGVSKWVPALAGKAKAGMVHSVSGWTQGVQVKLWDPLRTRAIPEHLRGAFTTRRYTNPRLPLPLPCTTDSAKSMRSLITNIDSTYGQIVFAAHSQTPYSSMVKTSSRSVWTISLEVNWPTSWGVNWMGTLTKWRDLQPQFVTHIRLRTCI